MRDLKEKRPTMAPAGSAANGDNFFTEQEVFGERMNFLCNGYSPHI